MGIRLTQRDHRLMTKLAVSRWLTTGQVKRFFFPTASLDAVRKRMRKLASAGFLHCVQPNRMAEALHTLGRKGKAVLECQGIEAKLERVPPKQLEHFVAINEVRLAIEASGVPVGFFFAAWELARFGWRLPVIPDAVCAVTFGRKLTLAIECDRGSETAEQFMRKVRFYRQGLTGFHFDAVLVVTDAAKRLEVLARLIRRNGGVASSFWGATISAFRKNGQGLPAFVDLRSLTLEPARLDQRFSGSLAEVSCRRERLT